MNRLILALLLTGCGTELHWVKTHEAPSQSYYWTVVSQEKLYLLCNTTKELKPRLAGCAFYSKHLCSVYSIFDEQTADRVLSADGTLFEHEVWNKNKTIGHCAGWDHPYDR